MEPDLPLKTAILTGIEMAAAAQRVWDEQWEREPYWDSRKGMWMVRVDQNTERLATGPEIQRAQRNIMRVVEDDGLRP